MVTQLAMSQLFFFDQEEQLLKKERIVWLKSKLN
jgi:hypothetical protein